MLTAFVLLTFGVLASPRTAQAAEITSDCRALRLMKRLARIDAYMPPGLLEMIDKQRQASCAAAVTTETILWNTGVRAKYPDGTWVFPNGVTALFPEGRLGYPRGLPAKLVDKGAQVTWSYPNGVTARFADGTWRLPDGSYSTIPSLIAWACPRLATALCREGRTDIDSARGDERELSIIELAWLARGGFVKTVGARRLFR
jgi:hypothetical protein